MSHATKMFDMWVYEQTAMSIALNYTIGANTDKERHTNIVHAYNHSKEAIILLHVSL